MSTLGRGSPISSGSCCVCRCVWALASVHVRCARSTRTSLEQIQCPGSRMFMLAASWIPVCVCVCCCRTYCRLEGRAAGERRLSNTFIGRASRQIVFSGAGRQASHQGSWASVLWGGCGVWGALNCAGHRVPAKDSRPLGRHLRRLGVPPSAGPSLSIASAGRYLPKPPPWPDLGNGRRHRQCDGRTLLGGAPACPHHSFGAWSIGPPSGRRPLRAANAPNEGASIGSPVATRGGFDVLACTGMEVLQGSAECRWARQGVGCRAAITRVLEVRRGVGGWPSSL